MVPFHLPFPLSTFSSVVPLEPWAHCWWVLPEPAASWKSPSPSFLFFCLNRDSACGAPQPFQSLPVLRVRASETFSQLHTQGWFCTTLSIG